MTKKTQKVRWHWQASALVNAGSVRFAGRDAESFCNDVNLGR